MDKVKVKVERLFRDEEKDQGGVQPHKYMFK